MKHFDAIIQRGDEVKKNLPYLLVGIIITGVSVLHIAGLAGTLESNLDKSFTKETPLTVSVTPVSKQDHVPSQITISKVGISLPVVTVPLENGTWKVNDGVANYAEGTSLISDKKGNVGIFAHDRSNGFTRIKELANGDQIELKTKDNYIALYTIVSKYDTMPSNVEAFDITDEPTLTLVTCTGAFSEQRHIVKAKLVSLKQTISYEYNF